MRRTTHLKETSLHETRVHWQAKGIGHPWQRCRVRSREIQSVIHRWQQFIRVARAEGVGGIVHRVRRRLARIIEPQIPDLEVDVADVVADSAEPPSRTRITAASEPMTVNWVIPPPGAGSGGHATILRIATALESYGHVCRLYISDRHHGSIDRQRTHVRHTWPAFRGSVDPISDGMLPAHATIATSWDTVYALRHAGAPGVSCYFVQDFEPWFYPAGSNAALAENTYRMGLFGITIGPWLAAKLSADYGMPTDWFAFGCDTERYQLRNDGARDGVVFYARPSTPRRGYELGVLALGLFARSHPSTPIHFFGQQVSDVGFPVVNHGILTPDALAGLYNEAAAALVLSFSNISLVPWEILACGCTPVMNEAEHNRMLLDVPAVLYANPEPRALADALSAAMARPQPATARAAARTVDEMSWDDSGRKVEQILRSVID